MIRNWELLHVFLEVAHAGTLRRAADVLHYTQPTLGKRIDLLEHQLGAKLFYRTRSGMALTPAGEKLLRTAEEVEGIVRRAGIGSDDAAPGGRVRVAVTDALASHWLVRRLRGFHRLHPHVTLDLRVVEPGTTSLDPCRREADVIVMHTAPRDPDAVVLKKSAMLLVPFCTRSYVEEWGEPRSLSDIMRIPVCAHTLHYNKEGGMRPWAELLERHPMVLYRTSSSLLLASIARLGVALSLQPVGVALDEPDAVTLDVGFSAQLPCYVVCHRDVKDAPLVRSLVDYLADQLWQDGGACPPANACAELC